LRDSDQCLNGPGFAGADLHQSTLGTGGDSGMLKNVGIAGSRRRPRRRERDGRRLCLDGNGLKVALVDASRKAVPIGIAAGAFFTRN
jgi:hypothetical protein